MHRFLLAALVLSLPPASLTAQGDPPRVVSLEPAHGATDVDPAKVDELVVTFDRDMDGGGFSFCGGGPSFPNTVERARWKTPRICVLKVELAPDHEYALSLNCPAARNFRSAAGVPLEPVRWSFATRPEKPLSKSQQRALNKKALDELLELLAERYSYFDRRGLDWRKLRSQHEKDVLASASTRAWAAAVGKMLEPTEDLHLSLRYRDNTIATGRRAIDPLFRRELLDRYLRSVEKVGAHGLKGRTDDGIGYLLIDTWDRGLDVDAVIAALRELGDAKALIVDVRPNSGGDELLAQRIAAWFVDGTKPYAKNVYRERKGENGFGPELTRSITGNAADQRFGGPVAVLMSRYVMSSCESFVLMMRQGQRCTLIGQRSYGSSGNPRRHELGNGVEVFVPSWKDLRLDGTCFEGEGIAPDIEVAATAEDLAARDPILERALAHLRQ